MDTRLDQYSSKQRSYKDFLREQGQQQIKELPSIPDAQPLIQPAPQEPQQPQYTEDDLQRALQVLQGGDYSGPLSPGTQYSGQAPITQPFGNRSSVERFSNGINYGTDFGVPVGTQVNLPQGQWKVLSTYNGAKAGYVGDGEDSGYGNSVYVQNMQTGEKLRLSHLSQVNVKTGQVVPGGVIGLSGATGNVTGPHLDAEYYTPNGQIADIARTPYANALFGQTSGKTKGKGGGNPFMDMLRNVGNTALGELDPANEQVPVMGPFRKFNREHFGQQPYADPNLPWDQRLANALQQYGNSFMGGHGDFGGVDMPTTKILNQIGDSKVLPKQHIAGLLNQGGVKQAEKDVINQGLANYGDKVSVPDLANAVRQKLLPLQRVSSGDMDYPDYKSSAARYESVNLPDELRGSTTNYQENLYNSPVNTKAGDVHFPDSVPGYFGHTRTEDVSPNIDGWSSNPNLYTDGNTGHLIDRTTGKNVSQPQTRRVLELQSDLFQKGRLNNEFVEPQARANISKITGSNNTEDTQRLADLSKLEPYKNLWQERLVKEEMKKAAQDGISKLQFPTGDTAMQIEGLAGNGDPNFLHYEDSTNLVPRDIKFGQKFNDQRHGQNYIITDRGGDANGFTVLPLKYDAPDILHENMNDVDPEEYYKTLDKYMQDNGHLSERFSLANDIDPTNPIHKFYESELGKYLQNKHGAQKVTDPNGVSWWEANVDPKLKDKPVEAFGILPLLSLLGLAGTSKKKGVTQQQQ